MNTSTYSETEDEAYPWLALRLLRSLTAACISVGIRSAVVIPRVWLRSIALAAPAAASSAVVKRRCLAKRLLVEITLAVVLFPTLLRILRAIKHF